MNTGIIMISLLLAGHSSLARTPDDPGLGPETRHQLSADVRSAQLEPPPLLTNDTLAEPTPPMETYAAWPIPVWEYRETIHEAADYYQLPPEIVAAIIWRESGGDPSSVSRVGAIGLMGIMPGYHQCASFNPDANIWCGAGILALFRNNAYGDLRAGLAAYNAGETGRDQNGKGWDYAGLILRMAKGFGYRR